MAVLIINRSDSACGDCGKSADLREKAHDSVLGWAPGEGCHAPFTATGSEYDGLAIQQAIVELRQDLPFTGTYFKGNGRPVYTKFVLATQEES